MPWPVCNTTEEDRYIKEEKLYNIAGQEITYHRLGLFVSAVFALIAIFMSWYLVWRHCTHYLKPWEQKHIIRILFMVPIYATVSFLSFVFYRHAVYFEVLRDCYEAFAIASFFALLCHYIAPDLHNQKDYFRGIRPENWVLPINWFQPCTGGQNQGILRKPRSGLTWFNLIHFGVFQYCFVRVFMTIVAVISQAFGRYCLESLHPAFAHIWVMVIEGLCVTVAMYCLIQFYVQLKEDLSEHKPLLKVTAIKLVIFLSFWQTILISFLTSSGAVKASKKFDFPDIKIGIPSMLLCIEMAVFSVFHLWAFPWTVYDVRRSPIVAAESAAGFLPDPKTAYQGGKFGHVALVEAFNPWDLIKAVGRGFRWFAVGRRTREQDISYKNHHQHSVGLEPTRISDPSSGFRPSHSFEDTHPSDPYASTTTYGIMGLGKAAHHAPYGNEYDDHDPHHDHQNLLSHAQPNPSSPPSKVSSYTERGGSYDQSNDTLAYPRPMIRYPTPPSSKKKTRTPSGGAEAGVSGGGDIGAPGFYADEDPSPAPSQRPQHSPTPAQTYDQQQQQQQQQHHYHHHQTHQPTAESDTLPSQIRSHSPSFAKTHSRDPSYERPRIKTPPPAPAYLYSDPADLADRPNDRPTNNSAAGDDDTGAEGQWDMWSGAARRDAEGNGGSGGGGGSGGFSNGHRI